MSMIYRLEVENFYCFRDRQVLDLTVPRSVPDEQDGRLAPIFHGSDLRAPRVVVAFGANGSGKSMLLKAAAFPFGFISESLRNERFAATHCLPFNAAENLIRPTRLAIEFGGAMAFGRKASEMADENPPAAPDGAYRYEIALAPAGGAGARKVLSEALRQRLSGKGKWMRVFERDGEGRVSDSKNFPRAGYAEVIGKLPSHASLLPMLAGLRHEPSQALLDFARRSFFTSIRRNGNSSPASDLAALLAAEPKMLEALNERIREIDIGVEEVAVREQMGGWAMFFKHAGLEIEMNWFLESTGTRSFVGDFPVLCAPLVAGGGISVVGDPDRAVHPLVLMEMLNWYRDEDGGSRRDMQLWMSCQTPSLLDNLTKAEVVFCEKGLNGDSEIFSLADIKGVRRDDDYCKKYLSGIYGAVPQCG